MFESKTYLLHQLRDFDMATIEATIVNYVKRRN